MIPPRFPKQTRFAIAILGLSLAATPAFAVNKDMVQLQTQVQQLQDAVARLQQSNDERMGVLRDLVQQSADAVNKMSLAVDALQKNMTSQQESSGAKVDQVSGQIQSLNDSLDEVKARINSLDKGLQALQGQQQAISAALQNLAPNPANGAAPGAAPNATGPTENAAGNQPQPGSNTAGNLADVPFPAHQGPPPAQAQPSMPNAPPVADLYRTALSDYMSAKYNVATSEFNQIIAAYPSDQLAGNAYYYLGEIEYRNGKFPAAIKNYDQVVQQFPGNAKIPVAHLHKGMALLALKQRDAGIEELRALIQRFPNSQEAAQARTRLSGMGVPSRRPS